MSDTKTRTHDTEIRIHPLHLQDIIDEWDRRAGVCDTDPVAIILARRKLRAHADAVDGYVVPADQTWTAVAGGPRQHAPPPGGRPCVVCQRPLFQHDRHTVIGNGKWVCDKCTQPRP